MVKFEVHFFNTIAPKKTTTT